MGSTTCEENPGCIFLYYIYESIGSIDNGIELDLSLLENGEEFTLNLPGGSVFEGTYYNGRLTGSFKYPNGDIKSIDIVSGVVLLDDKLWEPGF